MNPNIELFKRTAPRKKLEIIQNLTEAELLSITAYTVTRIIKETGTRCGNSRDKNFHIRHDFQVGNDWNSEIEGLSLYKNKLFVDCYVQLDSTDTTDIVPFNTFFARGEYRGTIKHSDHFGNATHSYYRYDNKDKAEVIRSFCKEYVLRKYKEKLQG